jgi:hypothetical protein
VRTLDVRLLVRGSHDADEALEQLLTGALRVHAAVELVTTPSGLVVPVAPIHRSPRTGAQFPVVRTWDGAVLERLNDAHGRPARDLTALVPPTEEPS